MKLLLCLLLLLAAAQAVITQVNTQYGPIKGHYDEANQVGNRGGPSKNTDSHHRHLQVVAYYGIPFAAPPTGDRRFKPPVRGTAGPSPR
jgi:carboxylesterase type B